MSQKTSVCLGILFASFLKKSASAKTCFPYHKRDEFLSAAEVPTSPESNVAELGRVWSP